MTKSELIIRVWRNFPHLTQMDVDMSVNLLLDVIGDTLASGHRVEIRGFGTFSTSIRPPRLGRNPKTGDTVHVGEKRVVHFKPGRELKERVDR